MRGVVNCANICGCFQEFLSEGQRWPGVVWRGDGFGAPDFEWFRAYLFVAQIIFADIARLPWQPEKAVSESLESPLRTDRCQWVFLCS